MRVDHVLEWRKNTRMSTEEQRKKEEKKSEQRRIQWLRESDKVQPGLGGCG